MLSFPTNVRVYAATRPVDGRKGIDGLAAVVRFAMGRDPLLCVALRDVACVGTASGIQP